MSTRRKSTMLGSSLTVATLSLLLFTNNNVIKADSLPVNQTNSEESSDKSNSATSNTQEQVSKNTDNLGKQSEQVKSQTEPTIVKSGSWGENGPKWSYDSSDCLKINGGTITGENDSKGAFADQDILKNVKKIEFTDQIKLSGDFQYWFRYVKDTRLVNLTVISGLDKVDTSQVTNMRGMFYASKIKALNLSSWDTSSVTDMSYMFTDMFADEEDGLINIGGKFGQNSKNVQDMTFMFNGCVGLSKIEGVASLNTSSVTSMKNMFHGAYNLTELDLSHFNTEKVTNMDDMLSFMLSLDYLDLSSFDTTNVVSMKNMLANDVVVKVAVMDNGNVVTQFLPGITTIVLGPKTKLKSEVALDQPNPIKLSNKSDYIDKWRMVGNDNEPQLTSRELLQKAQAGILKPGTYTWKKIVPSSNGNDSNNTSTVNSGQGQSPVPEVKPDDHTDKAADKNEEDKNEDNLSNTQEYTLMHNAYLYDDAGTRTNGVIWGIGSVIATYGEKTINGRDFYIVIDKNDNNMKYYVRFGNVQPVVRKLKQNAYLYNQYGEKANNTGKLKKGQSIKTYGSPVRIRGIKYYIIAKNRYVKLSNLLVNTQKNASASETASKSSQIFDGKLLMHNAYLYDKNGTRANRLILTAGSIVKVVGKKINNERSYYKLSNGLYIAAGNIDAKQSNLKHNAYLYNRYGNRTKTKLKKNRLVKTYGVPIRIKNKEYYIVNVNGFIKKANL